MLTEGFALAAESWEQCWEREPKRVGSWGRDSESGVKEGRQRALGSLSEAKGVDAEAWSQRGLRRHGHSPAVSTASPCHPPASSACWLLGSKRAGS